VTFSIVFDLRQIFTMAFPATLEVLEFAGVIFVLKPLLIPFKAKVQEELYNSLIPMSLLILAIAPFTGAWDYWHDSQMLALANELDNGKATIVEGIVSQYSNSTKPIEKRAQWMDSSFLIEHKYFSVDHDFELDGKLRNGDYARVYLVGDTIARIERRNEN